MSEDLEQPSAGLTRRGFLTGALASGVPIAQNRAGRKGAKTKPGTAAKAKAVPQPIRQILMVTDGGPGGRLHATYSPGIPAPDDGKSGDYFVFSELARSLAALPGYAVTRAHRDVDPAGPANESFRSTIERFRFDAIDLSAFDQIWLLGVGGPPETAPIDDRELAALARFMNSGGGVFATGDHGDIGRPLCGRVLRVRSMRTWWTKDAPDNEPVAPSPITDSRIDTTQFGAEETRESLDYRFDNQSDDRPAPIMLTANGSAHPALDLGNGRRLAFLPDHMHEGIVVDPFGPDSKMSPTVTYNDGTPTTHVEYPMASNGAQPRPQILALGTVLGGHATTSTEPNHIGTAVPTPQGDRTYGALGAYDGHQASVGRVFVTSTFHHLADINLIGDPRAINRDGSVDPLRRIGFQASPQGQQHLADQRVFWQSIARWLSRPALKAKG